MRRLVTWSLSVALGLSACTGVAATPPGDPAGASGTSPGAGSSEAPPIVLLQDEPLRLVTLGDLYTAGTYLAVPKRDSWPSQLEKAMGDDLRIELVANVAEASSTSEFVLDEQLWGLESYSPDIVTLLIGANDVIAPGVTLDEYRHNVARILDRLLAELGRPERIFAITSPDFTLTRDAGKPEDRARMAAELDAANEILAEEARERGISVIDISPVSDRVPVDPTLVIDDGLYVGPQAAFLPRYPSAKQYAAWVELIGPAMRHVLSGEEP